MATRFEEKPFLEETKAECAGDDEESGVGAQPHHPQRRRRRRPIRPRRGGAGAGLRLRLLLVVLILRHPTPRPKLTPLHPAMAAELQVTSVPRPLLFSHYARRRISSCLAGQPVSVCSFSHPQFPFSDPLHHLVSPVILPQQLQFSWQVGADSPSTVPCTTVDTSRTNKHCVPSLDRILY